MSLVLGRWLTPPSSSSQAQFSSSFPPRRRKQKKRKREKKQGPWETGRVTAPHTNTNPPFYVFRLFTIFSEKTTPPQDRTPGPSAGPLLRWTALNFAFFPLPSHMSCFLPFWGLFRGGVAAVQGHNSTNSKDDIVSSPPSKLPTLWASQPSRSLTLGASLFVGLGPPPSFFHFLIFNFYSFFFTLESSGVHSSLARVALEQSDGRLFPLIFLLFN